MRAWAKTTEKMDKIQLYFQYSFQFSMSDEESHSPCKQMWKITSSVFIVFLLRIVRKRPYNK